MDRFRDLERTGESGRKDASLLAVIASFEALRHPTSIDRQQFSNLFLGLFPHTRDDTKRTAAAALSRLAFLPDNVATAIADQPVRIAAPFLAFSDCAIDRILLSVIARHGVSHGRAISRRKTLSKEVVAALVALEDAAIIRSLSVRGSVLSDSSGSSDVETDIKRRNEEALRTRLRNMALEKRTNNAEPDHIGQKDTLGKLLTMQARGRNPLRFADCLALALKSSSELTDRIMLDVSGHQLAMAMQALGVPDVHIYAVLESAFPHLARESNGISHSSLVLASCDREESIRKVSAWRRAHEDTNTRKPVHQPLTVDSPTHSAQLPSERRVRVADRPGRSVRHQARRA